MTIRNNILCLLLFALTGSVLAKNESLYEIDGVKFNESDNGNSLKALVKVVQPQPIAGSSFQSKRFSINYDTVQISLKEGKFERWLEMEKNTGYSVCVDDVGGFWKIKDFLYEKDGASCIRLFSGNYVKSGKIQYITQMGNEYMFQLLVGIKYIDLKKKKHLLGYYGSEYKRREKRIFYMHPANEIENRIYPDSVRYERIEKILAVDKYKVTECEFIQVLWDSIPNQEKKEMSPVHRYWIRKKKLAHKNAYCPAGDSAVIQSEPYLDLIYANMRSLRDGLKPVYIFEKMESGGKIRIYENGDFVVENKSFSMNYEGKRIFIRVHVDTTADGYRLPYYNEWMALARGEKNNMEYIWGENGDSLTAARYAWFGVRDPNDHYSKLNAEDPIDRMALKHSCGLRLQRSRPVGLLAPNSYGLFDMVGLVCELVMPEGRSVFGEVMTCKGGFLTDSLKSLNFGTHCDYKASNNLRFQGLRLLRKIK